MKIKILKIIVFIIVLLTMNTLFGAVYVYPKDIDNNWSEKIVIKYIDRGITSAHSQTKRSYLNQYILKADIIYTINRLCEFTEKVSTSQYIDLNKGDWWEEDFKKAEAAGYLVNKTINIVEPTAKVNREEFMVMISRALRLEDVDLTILEKYEDNIEIKEEYKQEVANYLKEFNFEGNDLNKNGKPELIPQTYA